MRRLVLVPLVAVLGCSDPEAGGDAAVTADLGPDLEVPADLTVEPCANGVKDGEKSS